MKVKAKKQVRKPPRSQPKELQVRSTSKRARGKPSTPKGSSGFVIERRQEERRKVLATFHVFLCVDGHGLGKFYLGDISENGFLFESELPKSFPVGSLHQGMFFINPGLHLRVKFKVVHHRTSSQGLWLGVQLMDLDRKTHQAYIHFVRLLDELANVSKIYDHKPL